MKVVISGWPRKAESWPGFGCPLCSLPLFLAGSLENIPYGSMHAIKQRIIKDRVIYIDSYSLWINIYVLSSLLSVRLVENFN